MKNVYLIRTLLFALLWLPVFCTVGAPTLRAQITGFVAIDDILGESVVPGHEDEIEIFGLEWAVEANDASTSTGRTRARTVVAPLKVKKYTDASSPHLALACLQSRSLPSLTLTVRRDNLDYLTITLTNVVVSGYKMKTEAGQPLPVEEVSFSFQSIRYLYSTQAGDEHEIEYDIAAGV